MAFSSRSDSVNSRYGVRNKGEIQSARDLPLHDIQSRSAKETTTSEECAFRKFGDKFCTRDEC